MNNQDTPSDPSGVRAGRGREGGASAPADAARDREKTDKILAKKDRSNSTEKLARDRMFMLLRGSDGQRLNAAEAEPETPPDAIAANQDGDPRKDHRVEAPHRASPPQSDTAAHGTGHAVRPDERRRRPRMREAFSGYRSAWARLRKTLIWVGLFSAGVNILMLTGPIYMLQIYDRVLSSGSVVTLAGLFAVVIILYLFMGVYDFLRKRLLSRAGYRLDEMTGTAAFGTRMAAETGGRANPLNDLETVRAFLASPAILGLFDLPWIPIFLAVVFLIHPMLGFLTLAGAGVVLVAALMNERLSHPHTKQAMEHDAEERAFVEQSRRNSEAIRALGMQESVAAKWRRVHGRTLTEYQAGGDWSEGFASFSRAFRLLLQSALLTGGAYLALQQEITAGMIVATSILAGRALAPVDQVIGQWRSITRAARRPSAPQEIAARGYRKA